MEAVAWVWGGLGLVGLDGLTEHIPLAGDLLQLAHVPGPLLLRLLIKTGYLKEGGVGQRRVGRSRG